MKEIIFSLLLVGIFRGVERLGVPFYQPHNRKIVYLEEYKKRLRMKLAGNQI
jgi:hypothetical protein